MSSGTSTDVTRVGRQAPPDVWLPMGGTHTRNYAEVRDVGYGDREGYELTDRAVRDAAHAHDEQLRGRGVAMRLAGTPVQVRNTAPQVSRREVVHSCARRYPPPASE